MTTGVRQNEKKLKGKKKKIKPLEDTMDFTNLMGTALLEDTDLQQRQAEQAKGIEDMSKKIDPISDRVKFTLKKKMKVYDENGIL